MSKVDAREGEFATSSTRLLVFLFGLRWGTLIAGLVFLGLKGMTPGTTPHIPFAGDSSTPILALILYEAVPSFTQWKIGSVKILGYFLVVADLLCGVAVAYYFGFSFYLLAILVPICEGFFLSTTTGAIIAVLDLTGVFGFLLPALIGLFGNNDFTPRMAISVLAGESLLAVLILWLFLLAKRQEHDVAKWQLLDLDEKRNAQANLKKAEEEAERLFRELVNSKKEVDELQSRLEATVSTEREQAEFQIEQAARAENEAVTRFNELVHELDESRKERENLNFLVETSGEMHKSLQMEETLVTVVETLGKVVPSQTCIIFLNETENGENKLYAEVAASPYAEYFRNYSVKPGEGVVGWVAQEKEPAIIENGSLRTAGGSEFFTLLNNEKSAIVAPLMKKDGTTLGVIYLGQPDSRAYSWQNVNVLLRFVPHIQTAIDKTKEYHEAVSQGISDPITGLYNRVYFEERLTEEIKRAYRYQLTLSLIFLQIDRYEERISKMAETALNSVLMEMGELLRGYLRDVDVLARIGEGRFAILLVQAERSNAVLIAERIRLAVEMRAFGESIKQKLALTVSIGLAGYPKDAQYKSDLTEKCETGLAEAISQGGNKTCIAA